MNVKLKSFRLRTYLWETLSFQFLLTTEQAEHYNFVELKYVNIYLFQSTLGSQRNKEATPRFSPPQLLISEKWVGGHCCCSRANSILVEMTQDYQRFVSWCTYLLKQYSQWLGACSIISLLGFLFSNCDQDIQPLSHFSFHLLWSPYYCTYLTGPLQAWSDYIWSA